MVDAFCGSGLWPYFSRTQKAIAFSRTCTVMQAGRADGFFLFLFVQFRTGNLLPRCLKPFLKLQHDARHRAKRDQHNGMQLFEVQDKGACSRKHRHPDPVETGSRHQRRL